MMNEEKKTNLKKMIVSSMIPVTVITIISMEMQKEYGIFTLAFRVIMERYWLKVIFGILIAVNMIGLIILVLGYLLPKMLQLILRTGGRE